ncbi:hypothetical protein [Streptomyces sp. NPDC051452]|uniref:hypothetical protein n=1 Tax=Streptomyces sp. NPDC051452 TaxID=3365654 RepID=UPI00378F2C41
MSLHLVEGVGNSTYVLDHLAVTLTPALPWLGHQACWEVNGHLKEPVDLTRGTCKTIMKFRPVKMLERNCTLADLLESLGARLSGDPKPAAGPRQQTWNLRLPEAMPLAERRIREGSRATAPAAPRTHPAAEQVHQAHTPSAQQHVRQPDRPRQGHRRTRPRASAVDAVGGGGHDGRLARTASCAARTRLASPVSGAERPALPMMTVYTSSNSAVQNLTEGLARELQPLGIKVLVVELAGFSINFTPNSAMPAKSIADSYAQMAEFEKQAVRGDLVKSMSAIADLIGTDEPPLHLSVATVGLEMVRGHFAPLLEEYARWESVTATTDCPTDHRCITRSYRSAALAAGQRCAVTLARTRAEQRRSRPPALTGPTRAAGFGSQPRIRAPVPPRSHHHPWAGHEEGTAIRAVPALHGPCALRLPHAEPPQRSPAPRGEVPSPTYAVGNPADRRRTSRRRRGNRFHSVGVCLNSAWLAAISSPATGLPVSVTRPNTFR